MQKALAELRREKGLTQRKLARELTSYNEEFRFAPSTIALYELGLRTPNLQRAKLIARYFGIPVEEIAFGVRITKRE